MSLFDEVLARHGYRRLADGERGGPGIVGLYAGREENASTAKTLEEWLTTDGPWPASDIDVAGADGAHVVTEEGEEMERSQIVLMRLLNQNNPTTGENDGR